MEASKFILKRLIMTHRIETAMEVIKAKYPRARLITYRFEKKWNETPKEERHIVMRKMYVWFIKDANELKELF